MSRSLPKDALKYIRPLLKYGSLFVIFVLISVLLISHQQKQQQHHPPLYAAAARVNRIHFLGGNWFLVGYNYPWYHYGDDFGGSGTNNIHSNAVTINAQFREMASQAGAHVTRWFMFNDFRSAPIRDSTTGMIIGLPASFYQDMDTALSIAKANHLYLIMDFMDGVTLLAKSNGDAARNSTIFTDAAIRQSYYDKVVKPVLQRYGNNPQILAWSPINEPDYQTSGVNCGTAFVCIPYAAMKRFMQMFTQYVHSSTTQLATIENGPVHFTHFWTGLGFDFYSPHWYNWMDQYWADTDPFKTPAANLQLDKPIVFGELPSNTAQGFTVNMPQMLRTLYNNGYAGALFWSRNAGDDVSNYDGTKTEVNSWSQAHSPEVNIHESGGADTRAS